MQVVWLCIHVGDLLDVSQPFGYAAVSLLPDGLSMQYLFSTAFSDVAMMMSENALHRPYLLFSTNLIKIVLVCTGHFNISLYFYLFIYY